MMLPVDRWTIFYADGSTFTSDDGRWADAPPFGVTCVVYYDTTGVRMVEAGNDHDVVVYEGHAEGCEQPVKMPLWTDGESYWRVHDAARATFSPTLGAET